VRNLSWVSLREASSASALRECSPYAELLPPRENPRTDAQKQRVGHPRKPKKRRREQLLVEITRKKKEEQNQDSARSIEGVPQSQGNPGGNVLFWARRALEQRCVGVCGHIAIGIWLGDGRRTGLKAGHHKSQEPCAGLDLLTCTGRNEHE
jgi:hypothetical protein